MILEMEQIEKQYFHLYQTRFYSTRLLLTETVNPGFIHL